jgi:hypothetical protein
MTDEQFPSTEYFRAMRARPDRAIICDEWTRRPLISRCGWPFRPMAGYGYGLRSPKLAGEYSVWFVSSTLDIDAHGHLCGLTLEHARDRADIPHVTFEQVAA